MVFNSLQSFNRLLAEGSPVSQSQADQDRLGVSPWRLIIALSLPLLVSFFSYVLKVRLEKKILIAVARTVIQLFLAGYVLLGFVFSMHNPIFVVAYLLLMSLIAAVEATSRQVRTYDGHFGDSLISVLIGGALFGIICSMLVFDPQPIWNPQVIIPTCGMIIGNVISGPSVAVDRFLAIVTEQKHEVETRLAFGSTAYEAVVPTLRACILAGLMPTLNQMSVVGIVSIPGMMTGQLLGGAPPLVAAEYQMIIFWIICACSTTSIYISLTLACYHSTVDKFHRLTSGLKIIKKTTPKVEIDMALWLTFKTSVLSVNQWCFKKTRTSEAVNSYSRVDSNIALSPIQSASTHGLTSISLHGDVSSPVDTSQLDDILAKAECKITINTSVPKRSGTPIILSAQNVNIFSENIPLFRPPGLCFTLSMGERISIEGPSGLGKTRLLRALSLLDPLSSGSIDIHDISGDTHFNSDSKILSIIPLYRSRCIYVPQALPPMIGTPISFIEESLTFQSRCDSKLTTVVNTEIKEISKETEEALGLTEGRLSLEWTKLSGGERQRAIIACALIVARTIMKTKIRLEDIENATKGNEEYPSIVLCLDEPAAALDHASCVLFENAIANSGVAAIIITHDMAQAERFCHKRIQLSNFQSP